MLISKETLERIKQVIERNYRTLLVNVAGKGVLSEAELRDLENAGVDLQDNPSLLSLVYYHNVLNAPDSTNAPITVSEMVSQQKSKPEKLVYRAMEEHLNENFAQLLEKLKTSVQASLEAIIREHNLTFRNQIVQTGGVGGKFKAPSVNALKTALRDASQDAERDWRRVATTEVSNALGMGSIDRIAAINEGKSLQEVLVYRIPVNDAALCKYCRKFYLDEDGSPAVYRLTTLMGNGTNLGKRQIDWKPVTGATHPNERCSGVLELRPGWKVVAGGKLEFIGNDAWRRYISAKVRE